MGADNKWAYRDSGPVVRPYALTGGRTEPTGGEVLDLIAVIVASGQPAGADDPIDLSPEQRSRSAWSACWLPTSYCKADSP